MIGRRPASSASGVPGESREARLRKALGRRKWAVGLAAMVAWALLVLLIGPSRPVAEPPALGPARRDYLAVIDFQAQETLPDLNQRLDSAVSAVAIHYAFDSAAAGRRVKAMHDAFRLVRPRYRLYIAARDRLTDSKGEPPPFASAAPAVDADRLKDGKASDAKEPKPKAGAAKPATPPRLEKKDELLALDKSFAEEMAKLRPDFEAMTAARRSELGPDVFSALAQIGFAEEAELLLADVAQVLLSLRIVRDHERFDDDLGRGVLDTSSGVRMAAKMPHDEVIGVDDALRRAETYVIEFVRQKRPSRFDEPVLQAALRSLARAMVEPTYARDIQATRQAEEAGRAAVQKTRTVSIGKGLPVVKQGELVTPDIQARLSLMWQLAPSEPALQSYAASGLLLGLVLLLFATFARRHLHHFRHRPRDALLLAAILLVHAATLRAVLAIGPFVQDAAPLATPIVWMSALPHALGPALATLFLKPFTAAPFAILCSVVAALMVYNAPIGQTDESAVAMAAVLALVVGLAGVQATRQFRQRSDLARGTLTISSFGAAASFAVGLLTAPGDLTWLDPRLGLSAVAGVGSGVLTYLLLAAVTPIFESIFNRLTDIKLVELASMNHPALRLLATEAPGTFTHSVMVGNLAQAAADAIGANGLLARVGAYYHDLGKTRAPRYFAENQAGENPHDRLKPHLSALIIKAHVKDGIKILKEFGLPDEIIDFVPQHHGTSLIAHFFHRAERERENDEEILESDFRYPGPKPQRRETALLMLADAVEAAAKALSEPNPVRLHALVKRIIAQKTEDSQFDECDLTLRELAQVEDAFVKALMGIHHVRPVYLGPATSPRQTSQANTLAADEVRRAALLADGGVGVPSKRSHALLSGSAPTSQHTQVSPLEPPAPPQAPTAVVASSAAPLVVAKAATGRIHDIKP